MRAVVQRCLKASVAVEGKEISSIGAGMAVLLGVEKDDSEEDVRYIVEKLATLRIFQDENGKMNLDLSQVQGQLLLVSQFTLCGDVRKGRRPDYMQAASSVQARQFYETAVQRLRQKGIPVQCGEFGADMKLMLVNDGPVTIWIDSRQRE